MNLNPALKIFQPKINFQDKLFFTKHLATMIKAGVPIEEALETLSEQGKNKIIKETLAMVSKQVQNGKSLHESLKKTGEFSELYLNLISVGEESGTLEESLEFLAKQLAKDYSLRQKVTAALMYPSLVLSATIIMGGFIALYVLPKLVDFFEAFDFPLPLSTRILLFIANAAKNFGVLIAITIVLSFLGLYSLVQIIQLPIIGNLFWYNQLARFSRNFGVLLKAGIPITRSLEITANTLTNAKFASDTKKIAELLNKGKNIHDILDNQKFTEFPSLVTKMVEVGEKTGKLEDTLIYLADFYEEEIDNISKNLSTVLEPILLLTIGLVVGFVAMAIISPIYELTGNIRR